MNKFFPKKDIEKAGKVIKDFVKDFGVKYTKAYSCALVDSMLQSQVEEKDEDGLQLLQYRIKAPEKAGVMSMKSSILKKWKPKFFRVQDDFSLAVTADAESEKIIKTISMWNYKPAKYVDTGSKRKGGPQWADDESQESCSKCEEKFTFVNRRHHCRLCGGLFCGDCSSHEYRMPILGYDGDQRVCDNCWDKLEEKGAEYVVEVAKAAEAQEEDNKEFYGIRLIHETRRPYFFRTETKEEQDEWMEVLAFCGKQAEPPINPNPVQAEAFRVAYLDSVRANKLHLGWRVTGTEGEMISTVLGLIVDRDVTKEVFRNMKVPAKMRGKAEKFVRSQIDKMIVLAVDPAWESIQSKLGDKEATIRKKVEPQLGPVGKKKAEIIEKMTAKLQDTVDKAMEKIAKPVLEHVMGEVLKILTKSYAATFGVFRKVADELIAAVKKAPAQPKVSFDTAVKAMIGKCRGAKGLMKGVHADMKAVDAPLKALHKKVKDINAHHIHKEMLDAMHDLMNNAIFTIAEDETLIAALNGADVNAEEVINAAYVRTAQKMLNDSKVGIVASLSSVLLTVIMPPFSKDVLGNKVVTQATDEIDKFIPEQLSSFLSAADTVEEVLTNAVTGSVNDSLEVATEPIGQELDQYWLQVDGNKR